MKVKRVYTKLLTLPESAPKSKPFGCTLEWLSPRFSETGVAFPPCRILGAYRPHLGPRRSEQGFRVIEGAGFHNDLNVPRVANVFERIPAYDEEICPSAALDRTQLVPQVQGPCAIDGSDLERGSGWNS